MNASNAPHERRTVRDNQPTPGDVDVPTDAEDILAQLAALESAPLAERVSILGDVHEQLTQALSELDHL
jgi:nitroreductase